MNEDPEKFKDAVAKFDAVHPSWLKAPQSATGLMSIARAFFDEGAAAAAAITGTFKASAKVMRSHDYCHFEIALSTDEPLTLTQVDEMRKHAARLADKAVEQYKTAKQAAASRTEREWLAKQAKMTPESDRSETEKAIIKTVEDEAWHKQRYNYEDGDDDDIPF